MRRDGPQEKDVTMDERNFHNPLSDGLGSEEDGTSSGMGSPSKQSPIAVALDDAAIRATHHPPLGHGKPTEPESEGCCLISGDAAWQDSWDVLHMFIVGYIFVELPLRLGFRWTQVPEGESVPSELYMTPATDLLIDALMFLDMISRFFTTYTWHDFYGETFVVRDQRKIAIHYLRGQFGIDVISCTPFDTVVRFLKVGDETYGSGWVADHVRMLRLARAARLIHLIKLFSDQMVSLAEAVPGFGWLKEWTSMVITVVIMMTWNHFICCFLAWAGSPLHDNAHCDASGIGYYAKPGSCETDLGCDLDCVPDDNPADPVTCDYKMPCGWVTRTNQVDIQSQNFLHAYVTTYYWAFTIITTVGFGDIAGSSTRERFFLVLAMLFGSLSFGVIIGRVGTMVQSRSMGRIAYDARFRELQEYMQYRSTSQRLRHKVFHYLTTKFPNRTIFDESKILLGLPDKLRVEIQIENYFNAISAVPFLPDDDIHVRTAICSRLVPMTFMEGEHIIHEGALGREMYLIEHGKVAFVHDYQVDNKPMSAPCPSWDSNVGLTVVPDDTEGKRLSSLKRLNHGSPRNLHSNSNMAPWRLSPHTMFEEGSYFGEIAVLVQVRRTRSALADTFSNLLRLDKDTIDHCAEDFPKLRKVIDDFTTAKLNDIIAVESGEDLENWSQILADHVSLCRIRQKTGAYDMHRHFTPGRSKLSQEGQSDLVSSLTSGMLGDGQAEPTVEQSMADDSRKLDIILRRFDDFDLSLRRLESNQSSMERRLLEIKARVD